jgi:catechol 2,3-dioxygenase-like lactoylglutathione lyase family enzyme
VGEEAVRVELEALDHVGPVVSDVPRSVRWYREVLGLRRAHEEGDYGVAWSVYLPDPDGYQVEITTYEPAPT